MDKQLGTLVQILKEGSYEEKNYVKNHPNTKISPLFEGEKSYVHSVTTLATPHNGTTLADGSLLLPFVKDLLITAASFEETIIYHYMILNWINGS